eukprot:jgi/Botrbrau1/14576/Bobra.0312s0002.1
MARLLRGALQRVLACLIRHAFLSEDAEVPRGWPLPVLATPQARGEGFMAAVVAAGETSSNVLDAAAANRSLIKTTNLRYGLEQQLRDAQSKGLILLDATERDYALTMLRSHMAAPSSGVASSGNAGARRGMLNGHVTPAANGHAGALADAKLGSLISQVQDILPDFGEGFVAACLAKMDNNPERVINSLLEGQLPSDLASLDRALPLQKPAEQVAPSGTSGVSLTDQTSWMDLAAAAASAGPRGRRPEPVQATPAPRQAPRVGRSVARFMEERGEADAAVRLYANASQWEYEDEYDDSYDDLAGGTADGLCEAEGDDADQRPGDWGGARGDQGTGARGGQGPARPHGDQRPPRQSRQWVLDGRVYNYKKEGAVEVRSSAEAARAVEASRAEAAAIHGLGAGGNKGFAAPPGAHAPLRVEERGQARGRGQGPEGPRDTGRGRGVPGGSPGGGGPADGQRDAGRGRGSLGGFRTGGQGPSERGGDAPSDGGQGRGPPEGSRSGGRGEGRGNFAYKDRHKAAVANHHRKDRALRKFAGPPAG